MDNLLQLYPRRVAVFLDCPLTDKWPAHRSGIYRRTLRDPVLSRDYSDA